MPPIDGHMSVTEVSSLVDRALNTNTQVLSLLQAMQKAGCPTKRDQFLVARCEEGSYGGGFSAAEKVVVICHDQMQSRGDVENTMIHELIHAFDNCRYPGMDWTDCRQHACTEVRAASLSGDCDFYQELLRGKARLSPATWEGQHARCVARRAALSVSMNPSCRAPGAAAAAVAAVFDKGMADKAPFDGTGGKDP